MVVRRESVVLDLDDRLSPGVLRAAAAVGVLDERLDSLDGRAVSSSRSLSRVEDSSGSLSRKLDKDGPSIDRYSGRLSVLGDVVLALGPAAVASAAVAVPAIAGIASEVGFLAAGLGVTVLGFHGLGDALDKFNKASLDPTATNIANAQKAMDALPPSAQQFVLELHRMVPLVDRLRDQAAQGIFPGFSAGLRELRTDAPLAERAIRGISNEVGALGRDAGRSLSSREWRPFLRFLGREAPASIDATARSVGHVTHGLAELWMAFEPVNQDIDQGILRLAKDFDSWAGSLGRTKGFQDFLDYVEQNGPRVLDLLGQVAITGVDIGRAVAPLGGPTLEILTKLFEVIDSIATSDLGTPLFAGLLAFRLYARGMQLLGVQVDGTWKGIAAAPGQVSTQTSRLAASVKTSTTSVIADLRTMATEYARTERTIVSSTRGSLFPSGNAKKDAFFDPTVTTRQVETSTKKIGALRSSVMSYLSGTSEAAVRTRARLNDLAKGGAIAAGVAVVATGAADKVGLANTASLALAGSLAGPVGAAVGGAVGFTLDLAHANDGLVDSIHRVESAVKGSGVDIDFAEQAASVQGLAQANADYQATIVDAWTPGGSGSVTDQVHQGLTALGDLFTHTAQKGEEAAIAAGAVASQNETAFTVLHDALNGKQSTLPLSIEQLQQTANRAQPAMLALGISVSDLQAAVAAGDGSLEKITDRITRWIERTDSAKARTHAVAQAFADMADETLTTDQRVSALTDSLDALLGPTLGLSAATDQYTSDLHSLRSELDKHSRTLVGNTKAALTNRAAIRTRVTDLSDLIKAEANAGASPEKLTRTLRDQRQALIDAGAAAGISRTQMREYLDQLGLTPKLVRTAIELSGLAQAENNLKNLARDRVAHITVRTDHLGAQDTTTTGGHVATGRAGGGTVPGPRFPYRDKVLIHAAPGEEVITNRHGEADQFRADRASGRIPAYADGGTVTVSGAGSTSGDNGVGNGLRELRHELAASKQAISDERSARQSLVQRERALVNTVQDAFRSDVFANQGSVWSPNGGFNPLGGLRSDIRDARSFDTALHRLRRRGLTGGAFSSLAASGNLVGAQSLLGDSPAEIREITRLFRQRQHLSHATGVYAGQATFDAREQVITDHLGRMVRQEREMNQHLKAIEKAQREQAAKTARAMNAASARGAKKVRRNP